jgi:NADH-quinone oxidoreductase subunit M
MNNLILILLIYFAGAILVYAANKVNAMLRDIVVATVGLLPIALFFTIPQFEATGFQIAGFDLLWDMTSFAYIFEALVVVIGGAALLYSIPYMKGKENLGYFYMNFFLGLGAMTGILMSQDFVSFFIFWEIMTWSSYFIVIYNGNKTNKTGITYILFSALGAYAMLTAIVLVKTQTGSILWNDLFTAFGGMEYNYQLLLGILFVFGFGVKAAMMPLHIWAAGAYSNSPMSYTTLFSGVLSKMGVYGLALVMIKLAMVSNHFILSQIIAWLGAVTAVMATIYALIQNDVKKLLAYSSVAQLGYIITGIAIGTPLAFMAAIYLAILHALFKGALFMVVGAIEKQAGTTDMHKLRALIRKMPLTFITAMVAIIALAGIPPLGGFVGKWMLYESLIGSNHYFLVIVIFFSSTAAFLYSFRFLYGIFLGQEEKEFEHVKEAPLMMLVPMLFFTVLLIVTGTFPGFVLKPIANAMNATMGFSGVQWQMSVLTNVYGDSVDLSVVSLIVMAVFVVFAIFIMLKGRKGTRYVTTKDISNSGEPIREEDNYHYALDFYKPFERALSPLYKFKMSDIYDNIADGLYSFFMFVRRIYTGNGQTYAYYVLIFIVILLIFSNQLLNR